MAGMLPGVEAARRRRCHQSNVSYGSELFQTTSGTIRRSSFCLYAGGYHLSATPSKLRTIPVSQQAGLDESRLGAAAREAKKRLDDRLQQQWRSETKRIAGSQQKSRSNFEDRSIIQEDVQRGEAHRLKKSGSKRLNWLRLSWKSSEQEECAVCLERVTARPGKTLMQLPCAHKFHTNCLVPWLEAKSHCPCCRMEIPTQ